MVRSSENGAVLAVSADAGNGGGSATGATGTTFAVAFALVLDAGLALGASLLVRDDFLCAAVGMRERPWPKPIFVPVRARPEAYL